MAAQEGLRVTVLVTIYNDPRVERVVESVLQGTRQPHELLLADGGSTDGTWELCQELEERYGDPVRALMAPGNIPETRNQAIQKATGDVIAFIDTDEVATETWLQALVAPIEAGEAHPSDSEGGAAEAGERGGRGRVDFTGGPTPALEGTTPTAASRYYDAYMQRFYAETASEDVHALPMGNSAWRRRCFEEVGELSVEGLHRQAPGEDHDFAVRCLDAGFTGRYVPEAVLYHDYHHITLPFLLRKQFHYALGGFHVYRRHGTTYESKPWNLLPYAVPPGLLGLGVLALPLAPTLAPSLLAGGVAALLALFLWRWVEGLALESEYPGMRHRWIEVLRKYAVILAALVGIAQSLTGGPEPKAEGA